MSEGACTTAASEQALKRFVCMSCGWVYEEEFGAPDDGIAPGTRWADVPADWACPDCGAMKGDFLMVEF
jgi:rubredoxin